METLYTVERRIRLCKSCTAKCNMKPPVVGCESIMVPQPPLEICGKTYDSFCIKRIWFDGNYFPVAFWRDPTEEEFNTLKGDEWDMKLAEELKKIQAEAIKT